MPTKKSQALKEQVLSRLEQILGKPTKLSPRPLILKYGEKRVYVRVITPKASKQFWFDVAPRLYENHETDFMIYACGNTEDLYVFPLYDFAEFIKKASKGGAGNKPNFTIYLRSHEFEPAGQSSHRFKIDQFFKKFDLIKPDLAWTESSEDSKAIVEPMKPQSTPIALDIEEPSQPERVKQETYRILRDTLLAREVKESNKYKCHICGQIMKLNDERPYAEAHHVKPLGSPHNGPDVRENILCVCPNHHVLLDYGAIKLEGLQLTTIAGKYIDYHNEHIFGKR